MAISLFLMGVEIDSVSEVRCHLDASADSGTEKENWMGKHREGT